MALGAVSYELWAMAIMYYAWRNGANCELSQSQSHKAQGWLLLLWVGCACPMGVLYVVCYMYLHVSCMMYGHLYCIVQYSTFNFNPKQAYWPLWSCGLRALCLVYVPCLCLCLCLDLCFVRVCLCLRVFVCVHVRVRVLGAVCVCLCVSMCR